MNLKCKPISIQFGEYGETSIRKLRDSMPHAKDINNKSCFIETEVQIVFSVNMQITVWQTRFVADLENKMIVYT